MSYLFISRWVPKASQSPGWLSPVTISQMAYDSVILRRIVPYDSRSNKELQGFLREYLVKANDIAHMMTTVGYLYHRVSGENNLVMTAMSFMTQDDFYTVQNHKEWASYIATRNCVLDLLRVGMESKHYVSNDPTVWDQLTAMTAAQMSMVLDDVSKPIQHLIYP